MGCAHSGSISTPSLTVIPADCVCVRVQEGASERHARPDHVLVPGGGRKRNVALQHRPEDVLPAFLPERAGASAVPCLLGRRPARSPRSTRLRSTRAWAGKTFGKVPIFRRAAAD